MSESGGISTEKLPDLTSNWQGLDSPSLYYIITLLACYPLTYISRTYLHNYPSSTKHAYFTLCGLVLMFFNFGLDVIHSLIAVLVNYALLVVIGGSKQSVAASIILNMTYLITAYVLFSTDGYDIMWTTTHCIIVLKMIGTSFDLYDGNKNEETLSLEQKQLRIRTAPSLLELSGYTYFIGGCFVAPLFPLQRYLDFTDEKLLDNEEGRPPACIIPALKRLAGALVYASLHFLLSPYYNNAYMLSAEFAESSLISQAFFLILWGRSLTFKYSIVFLLSEGASIMSGLSYNGKDDNGNALWDGLINLNPFMFEFATTSQEVIKSYNVTTNIWASRYVYKRLKFLGNRTVSHTLTLFFLAIWHGVFIGYFIGFALEYFTITAEAQIGDLIRRIPALYALTTNPRMRLPVFVFVKLWVFFSIGFILCPISLLNGSRIHKVFSAMYYLPPCLYFGFPLLYQGLILLPLLKKRESNIKDAAKTE